MTFPTKENGKEEEGHTRVWGLERKKGEKENEKTPFQKSGYVKWNFADIPFVIFLLFIIN